MNLTSTRKDMEFQLRHVIERGGHLRMHATWHDGGGTIVAAVPGREWPLLTLNVVQRDGASFVGIALPSDEVRDGMPWDGARGRPVAERCFRVNNRDGSALSRVTRAVGSMVLEHDAGMDRRAAAAASEALAPVLQEYIERDPSEAAAAIADLLSTMMPAASLERLREAVAAKSGSAPRP